MKNERAIEILDPAHREQYESIEPVALDRRVPKLPHPDGDLDVLACPTCGSGEYLHNGDGNECRFCGQCGQAIDWSMDVFKRRYIARPFQKHPRGCGQVIDRRERT